MAIVRLSLIRPLLHLGTIENDHVKVIVKCLSDFLLVLMESCSVGGTADA